MMNVDGYPKKIQQNVEIAKLDLDKAYKDATEYSRLTDLSNESLTRIIVWQQIQLTKLADQIQLLKNHVIGD